MRDLGVAIIKASLKRGDQILAFVRRNSKKTFRLKKMSNLKIVELNIDEFDSYNLENLEEPYDVFFHAAWSFTNKIDRDNPVLQEENIKYALFK